MGRMVAVQTENTRSTKRQVIASRTAHRAQADYDCVISAHAIADNKSVFARDQKQVQFLRSILAIQIRE